ncbi:MAG: hypothetical protein AAGM22_32675 [Acidobacteriota bacterium]
MSENESSQVEEIDDEFDEEAELSDDDLENVAGGWGNQGGGG